MSVTKRGGKWQYVFDAPGSTKRERKQVKAGGFATKRDAQHAEAARRLQAEKQYAESNKTATPGNLKSLLSLFIADRSAKLAPKTVERYKELAAYISPELTALPLGDITPYHLEQEWKRLLASGGHHRGTVSPRPLSAKTVRNIAGVVSSAFGRAVHWGLVTTNPVTKSEPPVPRKHKGIALTPEQQELIFAAATTPWCLATFLELSAAIGARRGEVLALRWSDIVNGRALISRSLCQTDAGLVFKETKTEDSVRCVSLSPSVLTTLEHHQKRQNEFRAQFGPDYAAGDLIFANADGTPLRPDSVSSSVSALCKRLKLPKGVSLHTLRHSHGSHLLAAGVDLPTVSERLGHSSVRVTADVYTHAIRGRDDEAARKWEAFQRAERRSPEKVQ